MKNENKSVFDIIILEDVLGWMSRQKILPVIASLDWSLKPGGLIFIRDYVNKFGFCYRNHHVMESDVYSFRSINGHQEYFFLTGMYLTEYELKRVDYSYQVKETKRPDSALWSDALLRKLDNPLHPILEMNSKS